jgi:hypothetical protein
MDVYDAIARRLVADSRPVARLKPVPVRLAYCAALGAGSVGLFALLAPRPDLVGLILVPAFVLEIVGFAMGSGLLAALALRGAVPGREPGKVGQLLALMVAAVPVASALVQPRDADIVVAAFASIGVPCAGATFVLALAPGLVLFVALRRGVPLAPAGSGALAGGSALLLAYLGMRLHCPIDEGWHLLVWHALPIIPAMGFGALLGAAWLSRWQPGQSPGAAQHLATPWRSHDPGR